ncbi:MAG: hypothetical protein KA436_09405 [Oligoflexales bacterium]|nr:hypothetical protein [Oligoflexales bacterium]
MEKFKPLLKQAIAQSASQIVLKESLEPEFTLANNQNLSVPEFGKIEKSWLQKICLTLVPKWGQRLPSETFTKGEFNLVNVGKINLIAGWGPQQSLYLFLPGAGDKVSEAVWTQLHTKPQVVAPASNFSDSLDGATIVAERTIEQLPTIQKEPVLPLHSSSFAESDGATMVAARTIEQLPTKLKEPIPSSTLDPDMLRSILDETPNPEPHPDLASTISQIAPDPVTMPPPSPSPVELHPIPGPVNPLPVQAAATPQEPSIIQVHATVSSAVASVITAPVSPPPAEPVRVESPSRDMERFQMVSKSGSLLALVLSQDAGQNDKLSSSLVSCGYQAQIILQSFDFLRLLDRSSANLLIIDEKADGFPVCFKRLYDMATEQRSQVQVILLSEKYKTGDTQAAFYQSVDFILNRTDFEGLKSYLKS